MSESWKSISWERISQRYGLTSLIFITATKTEHLPQAVDSITSGLSSMQSISTIYNTYSNTKIAACLRTSLPST